MDTSAATRPAPGGRNDDTFVTGPGFAVILDGATAPKSRDSGCVHDVPWLVARLSGHLAALLTHEDGELSALLSAAIQRVRDDHRDTCDLSNPDSPSSTVTIVRERDAGLDYLVLGDSPLLLRHRGNAKLEAIVDDRVEHLPSYTYDAVARLRNNPAGFWVASTDVEAPAHALTGRFEPQEVDRALLLTDGASRLVERYGRDWADVLATAEQSGPSALLDEVRTADTAAPPQRGKRYDDATAVLCRLLATPEPPRGRRDRMCRHGWLRGPAGFQPVPCW